MDSLRFGPPLPLDSKYWEMKKRMRPPGMTGFTISAGKVQKIEYGRRLGTYMFDADREQWIQGAQKEIQELERQYQEHSAEREQIDLTKEPVER